MGFIAWIQSIRGKNNEQAAPSSSYRRANRTSTFLDSHASYKAQQTAPVARKDDGEAEMQKGNTRSRGFSLSRPKSLYGNNRRSWFGGRPDTIEDVPQMPRLAQPTQPIGKPQEIPLAAISRSNPADQTRPRANRQPSKHAINSRVPVEALPTLPAVPVEVKPSAQPTTSSLPADRRKSRQSSGQTLQRQPSTSSNKSRRRSHSRSSFWKSSNPDDSDSEIPPVPALIRSDSSESTRQNTSEEDNISIRHSRRRTRTNMDADASAKKPRPTSIVSTTSRKSYVPRSAAKGFLKSTKVASDATRKSFRRSLNMPEGDDGNPLCLTEEQKIEWAKLMSGELKLGDVVTATAVADAATTGLGEDFEKKRGDQPRRKELRHSNAQALAALEFGTAR